MIIDRHGGSVSALTLSLGSFEKDSFLDPKKTLKEQGVNTDGDYNIIYDFRAETHPLLTTQQLTKAEENEATREDELKDKLKHARESVILAQA